MAFQNRNQRFQMFLARMLKDLNQPQLTVTTVIWSVLQRNWSQKMPINTKMFVWLIFSTTLAVFPVRSDAQAVKLADCGSIKSAELTAEEKVGRLYDCIELLSDRQTEEPTGPSQKLFFKKPATYGPSWSTYNGYRNFEFAKGADGLVHLRGMMAGCPSSDHEIFRLPSGHRPKEGVRLIFSTIGGSSNERARVDIVHDGRVFFWYSTNRQSCPSPNGKGHGLTLEGLTFMGEQ